MGRAKPIYKNGKRYSSWNAYVRSLRGRFAGLPYTKKQQVLQSNKHSIDITRREVKSKQKITGKGFLKTTNEIEHVKSIYPKQTGPHTIQLKTKTDTYRINTVSHEDPETGLVWTNEVEEASRYTPAELHYEYEDAGGGITTVKGIKNNRIVTTTTTNDVPSLEKEVERKSLQDEFEDWDKGEGKRLPVSKLQTLGRELGVDVGGGKLRHPQATYEKRIRKKLAEQKKASSKTDVTERYYKLEKIRMAKGEPEKELLPNIKSKAPKYENEQEINAIINRSYKDIEADMPRHKREDIDQMEILVGAKKVRPDKNYNSKQLSEGIKVEQEHTTNKKIASIIAKDHLDEDPNYYTKLTKAKL